MTAAGPKDFITVIRAGNGRRLAKLIHPDGTIGDYDNDRRYDLIERPARDLDALAALLHVLMRRPDCAVVRGKIVNPARTTNVRRLAFRDDETGDDPTLQDAPHWWLALDLDGAERPEDVPAAGSVSLRYRRP